LVGAFDSLAELIDFIAKIIEPFDDFLILLVGLSLVHCGLLPLQV